MGSLATALTQAYLHPSLRARPCWACSHCQCATSSTSRDESIRKLISHARRYVGGIVPDTSETELREAFYAHGEIQSIRVLGARHCAFVTFSSRKDAERAADAMQSTLIIRGQRAKLLWGKPQGQEPAAAAAVAVPPSMMPPQVSCRLSSLRSLGSLS